jgi:hypothetical protein
MGVKETEGVVEALDRAGEALRAAASDLDRTKASLLEADSSGLTVSELAKKFNVSEDAVVAFLETARELLGERSMSVQAARRGALLAVSEEAWENELGPRCRGRWHLCEPSRRR